MPYGYNFLSACDSDISNDLKVDNCITLTSAPVSIINCLPLASSEAYLYSWFCTDAIAMHAEHSIHHQIFMDPQLRILHLFAF